MDNNVLYGLLLNKGNLFANVVSLFFNYFSEKSLFPVCIELKLS